MDVDPGVFNDSVVDLINKLCKLHLLDKERRAYLVQPRYTTDQACLRLKKKAYDTLFENLKGKQRKSQASSENSLPVPKDVDGILTHSYHLRCCRRYDDADRLEQLLNRLGDTCDNTSDSLHDRDEVSKILQVFVLLRGSGSEYEKDILGHGKQVFQKLVLDKCSDVDDKPIYYGESRVYRPNCRFYMHYHKELFESQFQTVNIEKQTEVHKMNIFEMTPGTGLIGHGLFRTTGLLNTRDEMETKMTLFGGLTHSRMTSLDMRLELPDLPEEGEQRAPEIKIPKCHSELSDDEGFISDISSSVTTLAESPVEDDIWECALTYTPSKHYTWERIGCEPGQTEGPYITEAGAVAVDNWYRMMRCNVQLMCPEVDLPPHVEISQHSLVADLLYLLIGIPSNTFAFDEGNQEFSQRLGIYISGITPDSLQSLLEEFLECGSNYYRLAVFSRPPVLDSFYSAGLIFQAFTSAIRKVLQIYRAVILSIPKTTTVMQLKLNANRLITQIRYLSKLCRCEYRTTEPVADQPALPTGIQLLSVLYKETLEANSTDNYPMMLSILQITSAPFTTFIQDWLFHGSYHDVYGEFSIHFNQDYLKCRDKLFWTHAYTLVSTNAEESMPLFLSDLARDIYICGKSINLMKICCPQHFICDVNEEDIPHVRLTFSERELRSADNVSSVYYSKMKQRVQQLTISRQKMEEMEVEAKRDLVEKAHSTDALELQRLQAQIDKRKKAADMKKRREFQRLKNQMIEDQQSKAIKSEEEKASDREYMARLRREESAMATEELELERQAREELIAYYAGLSDEAARREQKALWKVRRGRLGQRRIDFLLADEAKLKREMMESTEAQAMLNSKGDVSSVLPSWAQNLDQVKTVHDDQAALPKWADVDTDRQLVAVHVVDDKDDDDGNTAAAATMPQWAIKGLKKYGLDDSSVDVCQIDLEIKEADSPTGSPGVKLDHSTRHVSEETTPTPEKQHIRISDKMHATKETEADEKSKPQIQLFPERQATTETVSDDTFLPTIKCFKDVGSTKETESREEKSHLKFHPDQCVSTESTQGKEIDAPHLKRQSNVHANVESKPQELVIKLAGQFGHVSDQTEQENAIAPRLKKHAWIYANLESNPKDYGIRPRIRMSKKMSATTESQCVDVRSVHKSSALMYATKESEYVDENEVRVKKFKERNVYGHSTDSSVQRLLYGVKTGSSDQQTDADKSAVMPLAETFSIDIEWLKKMVEPYTDNFDFLDLPPKVDLLGNTPIVFSSLGDYQISQSTDVTTYEYMHLPSLLKISLTAPIRAQVSLVNQCILDYFFVELKIVEHFDALRRFLLMADGHFSQVVSDILFEKLATNPLACELLNPIFLNGALTRALQSSVHPDDKYAKYLSFALKSCPKVLNFNAPDTLDCLELKYEVGWPVNIVLTESSMRKYSRLFSFMLQLKRIVWILKDIWHRLKRDSVVVGVGNSPQFRQVQLHRQEMQHFVKVMQGYMSNQIIHVMWTSFSDNLHKNVDNLDGLHQVHTEYLDSCVLRSLLNKKALPVMKIIQDIFCLIIKFRTNLINGEWRRHPQTGQIAHTNFVKIKEAYLSFQQYSAFLFTVVNKLAIRGYQTHLQELLLRLNFNNYY
ncbi:gamma-tubulin complex component 6-like [Gigantopelta aegis]|uniref:gamma-tubulin complex component 6-like n=1 Tax=Gigantopelta aegis TaxID=1735272 RepID=UPI001B88A6F4|nr:gamma-tubulin complex component 6-like [Gigantopelta aegis]